MFGGLNGGREGRKGRGRELGDILEMGEVGEGRVERRNLEKRDCASEISAGCVELCCVV